MEILFQQLIDESLKRQEKREISSWHISKLGQCPRGTFLERLGKDPDTTFDERTLRVFDMGKKVEDWLIDLLRKQAEVEDQVRVEDKELNISGYIDVIVKKGDEKKVYEIKSKNSRAFWYMVKKGEGAMQQHRMQLWTYLYLLKEEEGEIVYVSKDDLEIQQYPVYLEDKELKKETLGIIKKLNEAWEKKDGSILPLYPKDDWRAKYCNYHKQCVKLK